jgi:steroid delta-isomerase
MTAIEAFYEQSVPGLTGNPCCAGNAVAFPFNAVVGDLRIEIIDVLEFNKPGKVQSMRAYWSM